MKTSFLLSVIIALILSIVVGVGIAPYHFFNLAQNDGIDGPLLKMKLGSMDVKMGGEYQMVKMPGLYGEDEEKWKTFHFSRFMIPLPIRHSMYQFVPDIKWMEEKPYFGGIFYGPSKDKIANYYVGDSFKIMLDFKSNEIFNLPLFKNYILKMGIRKIWKDIFHLKVKEKKINLFEIFNNYKYYAQSGLEKMVYELFILHMRKIMLKERVGDFGYYLDGRLGIIEIAGIDGFRHEKIFILDNGIVYNFYLSTRLNNMLAEALRKRFVRTLELKLDNEDSSIPIYAKYKKIEYRRKIDNEGMTYLYAAWSHATHKRGFLKEMIQFLERGEKNKLQIRPLYDYAFKVFGTTFGKSSKNLKETMNEKIKRKISEEHANERERIKLNNRVNENIDFTSKEEKIQYFLKKAKENGNDLDKNDKSIRLN